MVICTLYVHITMRHFKNKNIVLSGKSLLSYGVPSLLYYTMSQLSTFAFNFRAEIHEKSSPRLYIQTGVHITMGQFCHYATM